MKAKDVMSAPVVEIIETATVLEAAEMMAAHGVGLLVVTDENRAISGVVTDRDLLIRCVAARLDPATLSVGECASGHSTAGGQLVTVNAEANLEDVIETMWRAGIHRVPVTEDGIHAIGMVSFDEIAVDLKKYFDAFLLVASRHHKHI